MSDARVGMTITDSLTLLDMSDPRQPITGAAVERQGDGATTYALNTQYQFVTLAPDGGANWYVVAKG